MTTDWAMWANIGICIGTVCLAVATIMLAISTRKQADCAIIQAGALLRSQYIDVMKNLKEIASIAGQLSRDLGKFKADDVRDMTDYVRECMDLPRHEFREKYRKHINAISDVFSNFVLYCPLWVVEREDEKAVNDIKQIESRIVTFIKDEEWNSASYAEFCLFISGAKSKVETVMKLIEGKLEAVPKVKF